MGLFLLLILSLFFGWVFTESYSRKCLTLQEQLQSKDSEIIRLKEQHEFEKRLLRRTIEEMLRGV